MDYAQKEVTTNEELSESPQLNTRELDKLQLALVGGGIGNTII
jgi:hypothetical protein